jgi:hypothetical protein
VYIRAIGNVVLRIYVLIFRQGRKSQSLFFDILPGWGGFPEQGPARGEKIAENGKDGGNDRGLPHSPVQGIDIGEVVGNCFLYCSGRRCFCYYFSKNRSEIICIWACWGALLHDVRPGGATWPLQALNFRLVFPCRKMGFEQIVASVCNLPLVMSKFRHESADFGPITGIGCPCSGEVVDGGSTAQFNKFAPGIDAGIVGISVRGIGF